MMGDLHDVAALVGWIYGENENSYSSRWRYGEGGVHARDGRLTASGQAIVLRWLLARQKEADALRAETDELRERVAGLEADKDHLSDVIRNDQRSYESELSALKAQARKAVGAMGRVAEVVSELCDRARIGNDDPRIIAAFRDINDMREALADMLGDDDD